MDFIFAIYIITSFLVLFVCANLSYKFKLLDLPNNRKLHTNPTAYTGGIGLSFIYLISLKFFNFYNLDLNLIISISFLIAVVGLVDDKFRLNTGGKLSLQILPIFYLIFIEKMHLNSLGDYDYFKIDLQSFSATFTLLSLLFLINAFNYFDGIDGSLSFTAISVLVILFFLVPDKSNKIFLITILIPLITFLFFNFSIFNLPKLFLGDSGSLLLGFLISFILIFFANQKIVHPILLAWSISIFVYEFLSLNIKRISLKKNPFKAGLDHLHHKLLRKTNSIFITNIFLIFLNIVLFLIGYIAFVLVNPVTSIMIYIFLFFVFFLLRIKFLDN